MNKISGSKTSDQKKNNIKVSFDSKGRRQWEVTETNYSHLPDKIEKINPENIKKIPQINDNSFFKPKDDSEQITVASLSDIAHFQLNNDNGKPAEEKEFGFYCELCKITFKDSHSLLDHKNGKKHLRMEGLTMKVEKSTKESVLNKLLQIKRKPEKPSIKQFEDIEKELEEKEKLAELEKLKKKAKKKREDEAII